MRTYTTSRYSLRLSAQRVPVQAQAGGSRGQQMVGWRVVESITTLRDRRWQARGCRYQYHKLIVRPTYLGSLAGTGGRHLPGGRSLVPDDWGDEELQGCNQWPENNHHTEASSNAVMLTGFGGSRGRIACCSLQALKEGLLACGEGCQQWPGMKN